uniref:Nucleosome assembly protein 1-like 4 n=1 Tax=Panagrolaimus sp. JU765 TaxID=591449 RepID=A0AC34RNG8_9BILA
MANLPKLADMLGGDFREEPMYAENVTHLSKQQSLFVRAAKQIEKETTDVEMEFFKEVHALEVKYQDKFNVLHQKRNAFITGSTTVAEDEVKDVPLIYGLNEEALKQVVDNLEDKPDTKGIPQFWLKVFQNCPTTMDMIEEHDVPILEHLQNVESIMLSEPLGFRLRFTFTPNEYFEPNVIDKTYYYKIAPEEEAPYFFDGPIIEKCDVTTIEWKDDKNPTVKLVKRKQKKGKTGAGRFVTKHVQQASFFNFFRGDMSPDAAETDYEVATLIREQIIPHATVYFTGEAHDFDDFDEDDYGDFEDGDDESEGEN